MSLPELQTARLRLIPWVEADVPTLQALFDNEHVRRYLFDNQNVTRERTAELIEMHQALSQQQPALGCWRLAAAESPCIGFAGLIGEPDKPEILYALLPRYWNQGLATEAAQAVLRYAWESGLESVYARTDPPNAASVSVMRRLGMHDAGIETGPEGQPLITYKALRPALRSK
jgi:[ribosomal protein S5]-alanine N-acetyltransferase